MPHYRTTVLTPWSPQDAFAFLSDLEHFADWDPGVKRSVQVGGDEVAVGATFDVTVAAVGPDLTLRYEIVELESPVRVEVRAETSTLVSLDVITCEAVEGGGSRVTYDADLSLKGLLGIGNPILSIAFARIGDRAAAGLRQALEGTAADDG